MYRSLCKLLVSVWLLVGCAKTPEVATPLYEKEQLTQMLVTLDTDVPRKEAERLAGDVIVRSRMLNREFDRNTSPWLHNFLVNVGLKQKGLCYHFSDGLYRYLIQRGYQHFDFHLAGAHIGEYWREHNALVITAKKGEVQEGIVIDPWRQTGRVFISRLKEDRAYRWKHRPERGCGRRMQ
jgi:hypothetical protein